MKDADVQGQIWQAALAVPLRHEAGLEHPVLIVSTPEFPGPLRLVCPLTSAFAPYPWRIPVIADAGTGLDHDSYIQCEHLTSISTARLLYPRGRVGAVTLRQVQEVLLLLLGL
jgi:mRNA-degrading endonuclease toxin of MazEF toxin-antitoxin module